MRGTPGGDPVLDQINASETVELIEKSQDGEWYHIKNERGVIGWVHGSLLTIEPQINNLIPVAIHP